MSKQIFTYLIFCLSLLMIGTQALQAQPSYTVKIYITDGTSRIDTLMLGIHPSATDGIDASLGEQELPEWSLIPGPMETRFQNLPSKGNHLLKGTRVDIRPSTGYINQTDTFVIGFKSADDPTNRMRFSWDPDIGDKGGGRWRLYVPEGLEHPEQMIDMVNQPGNTFLHPTASVFIQYVYIIVSDNVEYRTFTVDSIAKAIDSKKKPKAEKMKPVRSITKFKVVNETGELANTLEMKYGQAIVRHIAFSPFTTATPPQGQKVVKYTSANIPNGGTVYIEVEGDKGKANKAKYQWYSGATKLGRAGTAEVVGEPKLLLVMPNYHNMGEELYAQGAFGSDGLVAGIEGNEKRVYHPKWKDVTKTMYSKGALHTGGPSCLNKFANGKDIKKKQKSLPSQKHNNKLLAEQVALKLNIAMADKGKVEGGYQFGDLYYRGDIAAFYGKQIRDIAAQIDSFLSCMTVVKDIDTITANDCWTVAKALNSAFSGKFDTVQWAGKLVVTSVRPVSDYTWLWRDPLKPPIAPAPLVRESEVNNPKSFTLEQNYPNPFNPTTMIEFNLPEDAFVTIKVYNMLGQEVKTLAEEEFSEGLNEVEFDASGLASGVYFYRIIVNDLETGVIKFQQVRKMMLVK